MLNKSKVSQITKELCSYISENRTDLIELNRSITKDTDYAIEYDLNYVLEYLNAYEKNFVNEAHALNNKPKGKILIILSFNEPFVMSVIPILNALYAGNSVSVRPSRKATEFFTRIWESSGIIKEQGLDLKILSLSRDEIHTSIENYNAVYFFGGHKSAIDIAKTCSEKLVEFKPEIEAADFKIINIKDIHDFEVVKDCKQTIHDSLLHSGQSCQRIQGVFVNAELYETYLETLKGTLKEMIETKEIEKYIAHDYQPTDILLKEFEENVKESRTAQIIKTKAVHGLPYLVTGLTSADKVTKAAYFLPTLWLIPYDSIDSVIEGTETRQYRLGINVVADQENIINQIVENTKYARYTLNCEHAFVRFSEGWGGFAPTGFGGYKSWVEHFSDPYKTISN